MRCIRGLICLSFASSILGSVTAQAAQIERVDAKGPTDLIHESVLIPAGGDILIVSGQGPTPIDPAVSLFQVKTQDQLGDTRTQTLSTLANVQAALRKRGFEMSDLVKMTIYLADDPKLGTIDSAGMNQAFRQFFRTKDNPFSVARATVGVSRLVVPHMLVEIEAMAAKSR